MPYLLLSLAIVTEVIGTTALRLSEGFTKVGPLGVVIVAYGASFFLLARVLQCFSVGLTYAIWSGVGIVLITIVGIFLFDQVPDLAALIGLALIIAGVVVLNLFSRSLVL